MSFKDEVPSGDQCPFCGQSLVVDVDLEAKLWAGFVFACVFAVGFYVGILVTT